MTGASHDADVMIVGGGPVGLALAGELAWRGNSVLLIEQTDGVIDHPKMDGIDLRVMEFCRRWGLVGEVRKYPFPKDYPQDMAYFTSLAGYELGRESFASPSGGAETVRDGQSPETRVRCPQTFFDPILRRFAESFDRCELRYLSRFASLAQDGDGVTVTYEDLGTNTSRQVRARYLVACDGANSTVRPALGIAFEGPGVDSYSTSVMFRTADLFSLHNKAPGYRNLFISEDGIWGQLSAINGRDLWRAMLLRGRERRASGEEIREGIRRIVGRDFDYEILSVMHWARRELIASSYRTGRAFLAGDAAHAMPPTGGFGMNTGIKDAVDLAWKLDAILKGWGGEALLDSYTSERRPVAIRAAREASGNWQRMQSPGKNPDLLDPDYRGALTRYHVGRRFAATMLREWYKLGIDLGYIYSDSPICCADDPDDAAREQTRKLSDDASADMPAAFFSDGTPVTAANLREWQRLRLHLAEGTPIDPGWKELPAHEVMVYRQSSKPGARAPHAWLADGRSTLDWYGRGFVLLRIGAGAPSADDFISAARGQGVPLEVVDCDEEPVARVYRRPLVLVRPDGHVAWRGYELPPGGAEQMLSRARGAMH